MSVPFLLCRNGTDCKRNGLSVPFLLFFAVPFNAARSNILITRARGAAAKDFMGRRTIGPTDLARAGFCAI